MTAAAPPFSQALVGLEWRSETGFPTEGAVT